MRCHKRSHDGEYDSAAQTATVLFSGGRTPQYRDGGLDQLKKRSCAGRHCVRAVSPPEACVLQRKDPHARYSSATDSASVPQLSCFRSSAAMILYLGSAPPLPQHSMFLFQAGVRHCVPHCWSRLDSGPRPQPLLGRYHGLAAQNLDRRCVLHRKVVDSFPFSN